MLGMLLHELRKLHANVSADELKASFVRVAHRVSIVPHRALPADVLV